MTNFKHLTQIELAAYHKDTLEIAERQQVKKHLLNCPDCRKRLPLPSIEQFWAAIMTDSEAITAPVKKETEISPISIFARFSSVLKLQSGLLWGSALLFIIFSFSFLLWLSVANSSREIAGAIENELGSELNSPILAVTPTNGNQVTAANSNRVVVNQTPKISKREVKLKSVQNNSRQDFLKPNLKEKKENISTVRGGSTNCNEEKNFALEFSGEKENFVFKWKKVAKAVKYHLYISDDDEILIDEYETSNETTFVLKKPLDPLKTYQWKIIVTLENGTKVIGNSQKFTVKKFQTFQAKPDKRRESETRCPPVG